MQKELKALATTAIGSVPYEDAGLAVELMAPLDVPASPQMVKISPWEDMLLGAVEGLPALIVDGEKRTVKAKKENRENDLAEFYEKFMSGDYSFLALPENSSRGFNAMMKRTHDDKNYGPDFLKLQFVGPLTFGQMVLMEDGQSSLVDDNEMLEVAAQALGAKGAWAAAEVRKLGRTPIIFLDEPGLSGYGSAFSTLSAETVKNTMGLAADIVRSQGPALVGCHVCGNTDWGLLMESGVDIINLDAFEFLEAFCLYPRQIKAFLQKGGRVAWGIVPAQGFEETIKADFLAKKLQSGWLSLAKTGIDYEEIKEKSLITSACGLGSLTPEKAQAITKLLPVVSDLLKDM